MSLPRLTALWAAGVALGCGAGAQGAGQPLATTAVSDRPAADRPAPAGRPGQTAPASTRDVRKPAPSPAPELAVDRDALLQVLDGGLGGVFRRVTVEPHMDGQQFVGFRIVSIDPAWSDLALSPGDTVTRLNGSPIARPEQAQRAFDGLRVASEIVVEYVRDGQRRTLRCAIQ